MTRTIIYLFAILVLMGLVGRYEYRYIYDLQEAVVELNKKIVEVHKKVVLDE